MRRTRAALIGAIALIGASTALLSTTAFADPDPSPPGTEAVDVPLTEPARVGAFTADTRSGPVPPAADGEWTPIADLPTGAQDAAAAWVDGRSYLFGGYSATQLHATATSYAYDTSTQEWTQVADLPAGLMQARAATVDGKVYLFGGWTDTETVATGYVYDPAADSWSSIAPIPQPRAAGGIAVVDGGIELIGGCGSVDPGVCTPTSDVWRYDIGTDSWQEQPDYPVPFAHGACGGVDGAALCAGGMTDDDGVFQADAYRRDGDGWTRIADLPRPVWGMSSTVAGGTLVLSNGIVEPNSLTNQTLAWDPAAGEWTELPAAGIEAYRGSLTCGLIKAGGRSGMTVATAETLPGYTDCGA